MNILFLMKAFELGGQEIVTKTLAEYFSQKEHNVVIVSFLQPNKLMVERISKNIPIYVLGKYEVSSENCNTLRKILVDYNINIVINQWGLPYIPARVLKKASKKLNIKKIAVYHNSPDSNARIKGVEIELNNTTNIISKIILNLKRKLFVTITRLSMSYVYSQSDIYQILSPSFKSKFKLFTKIKDTSKLMVMPNPLTISSDDNSHKTFLKEKEIIYVGRIDYNQKRVNRVIDTWALLENKFPDWKLTIVGDGCEKNNIEKQVKDLQLKRVQFEGFQKPEPYYKRASILILTSEYEGFGLVIVEAMSFGVVPAVYGSYSAVYDIIKKNVDGIICDYRKEGFPTQKMADKLAIIMSDEKMRNNMALNAIEKSKKYSIDNIYKSWEKIFNSLK